MDAKNLKSGNKAESKLIPLLNNVTSVSNIIDSILSYNELSGIRLKGQETKVSSVEYAADHLKDAGRVKEYLKIITDKWNIPETIIIDAINCVILYVKFPMLNDLYGSERRKPEVKKELSSIHKLISDIEDGSIVTLEITLKAAGKSVPDDVHVHIKSDAVVTKIFECLKSLPKAEIKQQLKGRRKGGTLEVLMQKHCAKKIKDTYSFLFDDKSKNELYEFIGYIFVAAGIFQTESDWRIEFSNSGKYDSYRDYLISKIKSLIR